MTSFVVVNPNAGGGRAEQVWPDLSRRVRDAIGDFESALTREPGDARVLVRDAVAHGARRIIAVGGDGTVNEAVNGIVDANTPEPPPELALLPIGTGCDFARGMGLAGDLGTAVARLTDATVQTIDLGRARYVNDRGQLETRVFANIASFGVSGLIVRRVNATHPLPLVPARLLYYGATIRALAAYRFQRVRLTADGSEPIEVDAAVVAVANGRYFGGGMMIAPDAGVDDGQLDIVILRGTSKAVLLRDLRLVYSGRHRDHPAVTIRRVRRLVAEPIGRSNAQPVLLELDGEAPGRLQATFEVLPAAVALRC